MKQEISDYEKQLLQNSGLYATVAPIMFPFLEKMRAETVAAIINDYKIGKTDFIGQIAKLATITDLAEELRIKQAQIKNIELRR